MKTSAAQDGVKIKGLHTISLCDARSGKAQALIAKIEENALKRKFLASEGWAVEKEGLSQLLHATWEEYRHLVNALHKLCKTREYFVENITTTEGRNVFARRLSGNNTYSGNVSHCALGTSSAAPAITDVQLGAETYRKALSSGTFSNNISYLETFFTAAEVSGTFQEYGFFIDGSQIFNRFIQSITKSALETMNVQSTVSWNDS